MEKTVRFLQRHGHIDSFETCFVFLYMLDVDIVTWNCRTPFWRESKINFPHIQICFRGVLDEI